MSITNPLSDEDLRALARRARRGELNRNEIHELDRALGQSGSLSRELSRIIDGKS